MLSNIIVGLSNLYCLRTIKLLINNKQFELTLIMTSSMISSLIFHLIETDEVKISLNNNHVILTGIFNEKLYYGHYFLYLDRICAIISFIAALYWIFVVHTFHKYKIIWSSVIKYTILSFIILLISEYSSNETVYVIFHSLWHVLIFQNAYYMYEIQSSPFWYDIRKDPIALKKYTKV